MKILVLDNYDSFTYNLVHYLDEITGSLPDVYRNDQISVEQIKEYDLLVLSPGPGIPDEAGILKEAIKACAGEVPIFGVCLGLQAMVEVFGGSLINLDKVYHGISTTMYVTQEDTRTFKGLPSEFEAARYHSWVADKSDFPQELEVTCTDSNGQVMAIRHRVHNLEAVQFHPESVLTPEGKQMLANFIEAAKADVTIPPINQE